MTAGRKRIPDEEMVGRKFGRLTVIKRDEEHEKSHGAYWICRCDCGNYITANGNNIRRGATKSCGCLVKEMTSKMGKENKGKEKPKKQHSELNAESMKQYEAFRQHLCELRDRKCLTSPLGKCPLAKYSCYEYVSFSAMTRLAPFALKSAIIKRMQEVADEMGYDLP